MNRIVSFVKRHPLFTFFVLAYVLAWVLILLAASGSLVFGFLALFGPTAAALIVAGVTEGRAGVKDLLGRVVDWRHHPKWYAVAIGLPILLAVAALGLNSLLMGAPMTLAVEQPLGLTVMLAILVIGEEIGWRGFALPRLQARYNSLGASLLLGVFWAAWHLPNALLPGLGHYVTAFPAFLLYVIGMTVLFTWLANHTRNAVLLAWIFHAAINVSGAYLSFGDSTRQWWLNGAVYAVSVLILLAVTGVNLGRKAAAQNEFASAEQPVVG